MLHKLKILKSFLEAIESGDKTFEIRKDQDRGFQRGDMVVFREVESCDIGQAYSGRELLAEITYVSSFYQPENQVVFAIRKVGEFYWNEEVLAEKG